MRGGAVTDRLRVTLETGPKGKKVVAVELAGMGAAFAAATAVEVVERYAGTGSTDFWGISFAFSAIDRQEMSPDELTRETALMQACWAFFDAVRPRVSAEMQRGPRGG